MSRKGLGRKPEPDKDGLVERFNRFSDDIVRAAELILLTGAFAYATAKSTSLLAVFAAGLVTILLFFVTAVHIGFRFANRAAVWIDTDGQNRFWRPVLRAIAYLVVAAIATVSGLAVIALSEALVAASGG